MDEDFGTFGPLDSRIRWTKWQLGMARPPNDYRKTKFPCRKTRIAGISQSKFVPTVANDLRRKMRGWMRPETIAKWLEGLPRGSRVLDPMCDSGVVLRLSVQLGHKAQGYDVDPLAVLMSRVWTRQGNHGALTEYAEDVVKSARRRRTNH